METNHQRLTHKKNPCVAMINEQVCVEVHTPWGKCPFDDYSQYYLALLIPGSRLNAANAPGAHPYYNHQPLNDLQYIECPAVTLCTCPKVTWPDVSWLKVTWLKVTWLKVTWPDVSWLKVTWLKVTWPDVSWLKVTYPDIVQGAREAGECEAGG